MVRGDASQWHHIAPCSHMAEAQKRQLFQQKRLEIDAFLAEQDEQASRAFAKTADAWHRLALGPVGSFGNLICGVVSCCISASRLDPAWVTKEAELAELGKMKTSAFAAKELEAGHCDSERIAQSACRSKEDDKANYSAR